MKHRNESAITLVALVITIIVLLILAGITISLTVGQDGILKQAQQAGIKNEEAEAREKLELALLDLQADKRINANYNENEYIDIYLANKQMVVMGDIVLVDGWQFQIDRSVPKIAMSLGKGEESKQIVLVANVEDADDYTKARINVEISYDGEIKSVQINGQEEQIPEKIDGKYVLQKEILTNGSYTIFVKDTNDNYKIATVQVREISEDTKLESVEDFIAFRDKVNNGATFEGKTVTLMNDIDLQGSETNQWIPIGSIETKFAGTFNGNYHNIKNLYIKSNIYQRLGLFTSISTKAIIRNLILENVYIYNSYTSTTENSYTGGIAGVGSGKIINCGINNGSIIGYKTSANTTRGAYVGGICGYADYEISDCYNKATIESHNMNNESSVEALAGGITGALNNGGVLSNCYNVGSINSISYSAKSGGIMGSSHTKTIIKNSYNIGNAIGTGSNALYVAGIVARNGFSSTYAGGTISNCYCTTVTSYSYNYWDGSKITPSTTGRIAAESLKTYTTTLGDAYTSDVQNEDGTWKYNNGYPILKWQVQE